MAEFDEKCSARIAGSGAPQDVALCSCGLNAMCASLSRPANRSAFRKDEKAYCRAFSLSPGQQAAIQRRDLAALIAGGGEARNITMLAKLWGISADPFTVAHKSSAARNGMSVDAFRAKLLAESSRGA